MGWTDGITEEEKAFIKKHFVDMTIAEIALSLGRSYEAIRNHCAKMNLHRFHKWTAEEDRVLFELWGRYPADYVATQIGVDANCVYNRVRRLKKNGKFYDYNSI